MNQGPLDLRDYLAVLWARKWTIIVVALVTTGVALAYSLRQTPVYTSSAEVVVRSARFDPLQAPAGVGLILMKTEEQVANSRPVTDLAKKRLADEGVTPGSMGAAQVPEAETLLFTSTSPDAEAAQATADAHAQAYLDLREKGILNELEQSREPYVVRIAELDDELRGLSREITATRDEVSAATLEDRYAVLVAERAAVAQRLGDLATPQSVRVGELLQPAKLPDSPSSPKPIRDAIVGFIVGLALGVGLAFFRERMDDRVRGREDLEEESGAPVLAFIPVIESPDSAPIMLSDPTSDGADAYKSLQVRILHVASQRSIKCVVITSSMPGEGKTSTTANLGIALAKADRRVVLVSADLRRPRLQTYFRGEDGRGLTKVLLGHRRPADVISSTGVRNLWFVDSGPTKDPERSLALLGSDAMRGLLDELRDFADLILIDTPPLLTSPDVVAIGPMTDGALMVTDPRLAQRPTVEQARRELELMDVPLIGVVVNRYDPRRFSPYSSGYGYGYRSDGREHRSAHSSGGMTLQAVPDDRED